MNTVKFEDVGNNIILVREEKVMLDSDVAQLYGVATKEINQAVKNNAEKFPQGYIIILSKTEKNELVKNFDRFNILKHSTANPKAFTEKGLYMLATIIKSERATQTTLSIIETFARIKNLSRNIKELTSAQDEQTKQVILKRSGEMIAEIFDEDLSVSESETTVELNFAVLKFKHTIKKKKDKK